MHHDESHIYEYIVHEYKLNINRVKHCTVFV